MNEATRRALQRIDTAFYHERAGEFATKRAYPWPGWQRVIAIASEHLRAERRPAILDAGCGHGRFARALALDWPGEHRYVGVDKSAPLLEIARRETMAAGQRFFEGDLLGSEAWARAAAEQPRGYDLIAAFGLLHHVPGDAARSRLVRLCARHLTPGGVVALSFWQFGDDERLRRKLVDWSSVPAVDTGDLEPGDHLMRWGPAGGPAAGSEAGIRFCHLTTPDEADALVASAGLEPIDRFRADGRSGSTNYYVLATRADRSTT